MPGVLNLGIGGNRVLSNPPAEFPFFGPSALARFDREVLALAGVTHLIVFEGINDIALPVSTLMSAEPVTADQLIAGSTAIGRARPRTWHRDVRRDDHAM